MPSPLFQMPWPRAGLMGVLIRAAFLFLFSLSWRPGDSPLSAEALIVLLWSGPSFFLIPLPYSPNMGLPSLTLNPHDRLSIHPNAFLCGCGKMFYDLQTRLNFSLDLPQLPGWLRPWRTPSWPATEVPPQDGTPHSF